MAADDLERLIDARLRQLPLPPAPDTLVPRVMRAVDEWAARPWYRRAWFTWPIGLRLASVAAAVALVTAAVLVLPVAYAPLAPLVTRASGQIAAPLSSATERVEVATTATRVVWRVLIAPVVPYAIGLVMFMYVACALAGSALSYLVFGKAVDR